MILRIKDKDGIKEIKVFSLSLSDNKDIFKYSTLLNNVELQVDLINDDKEKYYELEANIKKFTPFTSVKIEIKPKHLYSFILILKGRLCDVFGMLINLQIKDGFEPENYYLKQDLNLIKYLLNRKEIGDFSLSESLILRFLSEQNAELSYPTIYDILKRDFKKSELKRLLPELFKKVYGFGIEEVKLSDLNLDKMNLDYIHTSVIRELEHLEELIENEAR